MQNRTAIAEMILEIPQDEYTCNDNKDVIMDVTGLERKLYNPDITDATASSYQQETRVDSNSSNDLDIHGTSQSEATATNEQVADSHRDAQHQNVNADDSDKIVMMPDLPECMLNNKTLDDPELKRMVMEVIFGSINTSAIEQTDSDKPTLETSDSATGRIDTNDNVSNATTIDESKEASCPTLENVRHQRPTRNRIKPLSKDFVYDLKKVAHRKESALINDSETLHIRKKVKLYN